jgi:purine-binding chemotaxis protein CheW
MKKTEPGSGAKGKKRQSPTSSAAVKTAPAGESTTSSAHNAASAAAPAPAVPGAAGVDDIEDSSVTDTEADGEAEAYDPLDAFFVSDEERRRIAQSFSGEGTVSSPSSHDMVELLAFWVADEEYALHIVEIQEIIKVPGVTELPRAHAAVLGIISLRGTIVPVLDLRHILRLEARPITRQARILVVRTNDDPVGLLVDRVTSVARLEADKVEATPRTMQRQTSELVRGVGRVGTRLLIVLDINAVMDAMENPA